MERSILAYLGSLAIFISYRAFQWGKMFSPPSPDSYRVNITKSKPVGLLHWQNKSHMQKISIVAQYLGSLSTYISYRGFLWGNMPSYNSYRVKITKSKLVGLLHSQNEGYMQKISILAQYLCSKSNLSVFASKVRMTKYVRIAIFQNFFKDITKIIFLGGTKMFNL